jgi:hypothetical protein
MQLWDFCLTTRSSFSIKMSLREKFLWYLFLYLLWFHDVWKRVIEVKGSDFSGFVITRKHTIKFFFIGEQPKSLTRIDVTICSLSFYKMLSVTFNWGRAMAQVVSRLPLTAEAWVHARVNPCGICGGQSGTGTVLSPSYSVFLCQYSIPPSLSKLVSSA